MNTESMFNGMRRGKADRFERQMEKAFQRWANGQQEEGWLTEFIKEMRREHQAVVRIVRKEILYPVGKSERCEGWNQALQCILELLKERAR